MEVNTRKCGIMLIKWNSVNTNIGPLLYEEIPIVDKYVYLGIEFNKDLNTNERSAKRLNIVTKLLMLE